MMVVDRLKVLELQMAVERSVTCFILVPERKWTVSVFSPDLCSQVCCILASTDFC